MIHWALGPEWHAEQQTAEVGEQNHKLREIEIGSQREIGKCRYSTMACLTTASTSAVLRFGNAQYSEAINKLCY
jgi:hypothetical protein